MIGELGTIINNLPGMTNAAYLAHKKQVAQKTFREIPVSVEKTKESIKKSHTRTAKVSGLLALNAAYLYGDDIGLYTIYARTKRHLSDGHTWGRTAAMAGIGLVAAAVPIGIAKLNNEHLPMLDRKSHGLGVSDSAGFAERFVNHYRKIRHHLGKLSLSLMIGVPSNAIDQEFSKKEVYLHSAIYGAVAAGLYEASNVSLGALDNPLAPAALVTTLLGTKYINKVCNRASGIPENDDILTPEFTKVQGVEDFAK